MTLDTVAELTERIRYLQDWIPPSQRHRLQRPRSAPYRNRGLPDMIHRTSADGHRSVGEFYAFSNLKEEIANLKTRIDVLSSENSALRKSRRELEGELARTKRELAEAEVAATEARARVSSLDEDVEKLCELSKLLTRENAAWQLQNKDMEIETKGLKAQAELLKKEGEIWASVKEQNEELKKEVLRWNGDHVDRLKAWKEESEALEEEVERLKGGKEKLEMEVKRGLDVIHHLKAEKEVALARVEEEEKKRAQLGEQLVEMEDAMVEYQGQLRQLSSDVARARSDAASAHVHAWTPPEPRRTRAEAGAGLQEAASAFSRGIVSVEAEVRAWKERVTALEAALRFAKDGDPSFGHGLAELGVVNHVLKGRALPTPVPPSHPPQRQRAYSTPSLVVPATFAASGALAGGLYAAVKLLSKSSSFS